MNDYLSKLYEYLKNNGYQDDANKIKEIQDKLKVGHNKIVIQRLIAMCNPRYLGNHVIKEFNDVYQWWNFLGEISETAKNL